ncbi:pyridoxal phosphate-dependent aminotransferase [Actinomyces minihominis]|uniref:pyridoxal phosphate-dependent aminotransferase n=1 Tax=Actinomyces minihominis TaxID=2002838 RepID=UPI000C06FDA4|nr:pyridoxal phosphate-dependent aminotransferase [Actinomyces minihominis]
MSKKPIHRVSKRLSAITPSATLAIDAKSKALKAAGQPVINFAPGEPNFDTPRNVVEAALAATEDPTSYRYTPGNGLLALREAVAQSIGVFGNAVPAATDVLITNGGKQAVYQACAAIIDEGDEVLLPAPYWTTYPETVKLAGGVPVDVVADISTGYKVTVEQLEAARTDRTIALIFCSPSNPTGAVYSPEEVTAIGKWALENGIWVIADDIYEALVYDGVEVLPMYRAVPELANQMVVLSGVAKKYAMTGWRVGWMIGPSDVIKAAGALQSHLTSNVNNIAQKAAIEALTGPQGAVEEMREAFDRRRRLIVSMLREIPEFDTPMPEGAFYVYSSVKGALGREINGKVANTSSELADLILDEALVAVVPGEAFGTPGYIRLSYAVSDEDLIEGITRIRKLLA